MRAAQPTPESPTRNKRARKRKRAAAVACTDWLGAVTRDEAIVAAGFCQGLAARDGLNLTEWERSIVRKAGIALAAIVMPNTKLSGGGPLSNKTTEAESRRPLE